MEVRGADVENESVHVVPGLWVRASREGSLGQTHEVAVLNLHISA